MNLKSTLIIAFVFLMMIIPVGGVFIESSSAPNQDIVQSLPTPASAPDYKSNLKVYDLADGKVHTITPIEYVAGAVALEMPANFDPQALAAQAVAAHTYARYCQLFNQTYKNSELKGADFMVDTENMVGYLPKERVKEMYGDKFEESWTIITEAAQVGISNVLEYEGSPILAAYHATSAGVTEAAENVWNSGFDYLVPVSSPGDLATKGFRSTVEFSPTELKSLLSKAFTQVKLGSEYQQWIMPISYSDSGYIVKVKVGDTEVHGKQLRTALNLRSTNFTISYRENKVIITTVGYGHGVGLSQNGANYMAVNGSLYPEILGHYYPNTVLKKVI